MISDVKSAPNHHTGRPLPAPSLKMSIALSCCFPSLCPPRGSSSSARQMTPPCLQPYSSSISLQRVCIHEQVKRQGGRRSLSVSLASKHPYITSDQVLHTSATTPADMHTHGRKETKCVRRGVKEGRRRRPLPLAHFTTCFAEESVSRMCGQILALQNPGLLPGFSCHRCCPRCYPHFFAQLVV